MTAVGQVRPPSDRRLSAYRGSLAHSIPAIGMLGVVKIECHGSRYGCAHGITLMLFGDHLGEVPLPRTVICQTALALVFSCITSLMIVDALAASPERVEFESAAQPFIPSDRIKGLLAKPDGAGPFLAVVGLHGCAGMQEATKRKLVV